MYKPISTLVYTYYILFDYDVFYDALPFLAVSFEAVLPMMWIIRIYDIFHIYQEFFGNNRHRTIPSLAQTKIIKSLLKIHSVAT